jgi:DNA-directed RNA polymerase specialized sigma24 family protein
VAACLAGAPEAVRAWILSAFDTPASDEQLATLSKRVSGLPREQRLAFVLRYGQGLHAAEVAARLGISERALESLIAAAFRALCDGVALVAPCTDPVS